MGKRDSIYAADYGPTGYPNNRDPDSLVIKSCDICGRNICVNMWPDGKSRTPKFKGFIVCIDCDPRAAEDHYRRNDEGAILFRGRLRIIRLAMITRAAAAKPCFKGSGMSQGCKCLSCSAGKIMPPF